MKLTWFGHSTIRLDMGSSALMIDPFLKGNPTFEKSGVAWAAATKGITHVALTHGHPDHTGDAAEICKTNNAPLLATYELAMFLKGKGAEKIEPMNTGGTIYTKDFDLTLVHALHSSTQNDTPLGSANGIVVTPKNGPVVYHMGDTDMFSDMALIAEYHRPQVLIVPIGDRFTMGAKRAAFACKKFFGSGVKAIIPVHFGTFAGMLDPDAEKFKTEMSGHRILTPHVGATIEI